MARRSRTKGNPGFTPPLEPARSRDERRALGAYYTPPEIVRVVVDRVLGPLLARAAAPRVLDPACGGGEFLMEVHRRLRLRYRDEPLTTAICGVDLDPAAVRLARGRLAAEHRPMDRRADKCILLGDALDPRLLQVESFDAVLGNPPYMSIRQLARSWPRARIDELRAQYAAARGNFDLYALFLERAVALLRPGGRCGLIVPNKWATADYARPCRELLLNQTAMECVLDLTGAGAFAGAAVYPQVLVFRKQPASRSHAVIVQPFECTRACAGASERVQIPQRLLSPVAVSLTAPLDVESRGKTWPLGDVARLACGTAGYAAAAVAGRLGQRTASASVPFITTGNIDRFSIQLGNVRFLNRMYADPRLPLDAPELSAARRTLFSAPKIVIAGMSRRLEAAYDDRGVALGVQVFAASPCQVDPYYLLALLNSKLLSYLFATRYAAKRLGGGYLAINKGQLARLPIRLIDQDDARARRLADLARSRNVVLDRHNPPLPCKGARRAGSLTGDDRELDTLVYDLYELTAAEIARVEAHGEQVSAKAA
jgi:SAM-dependent methyltransferase